MSPPAQPIAATSVSPPASVPAAPAFRVTTLEEQIATLPWPLRLIFRLASFLFSPDSTVPTPSHQ